MRRVAKVLAAVLFLQVALFLIARLSRIARRSGYPDPMSDLVDLSAVMDSVEFGSQARALREVRVRNVLGHVALDLRNAVPAAGGSTVEVETTLASTSIIVPRGWRVVVTASMTAAEHHIAVTPEDDLSPESPVLRVVARTRLGALTVTLADGDAVAALR